MTTLKKKQIETNNNVQSQSNSILKDEIENKNI